MNTNGKINRLTEADKRYNAFLKYIKKRMKELEKDEKKFREAILKPKKFIDSQ